MWARHAEFFLAIWLAISWAILHYTENWDILLLNDYICSVAIAFFSLLSYLESFRYVHLINFLIALWLIGFSLFPFVPEAARQNYVTLGILLLMLSIIPSHIKRPPTDWVRFLEKRD